jgi:hypothetical protein
MKSDEIRLSRRIVSVPWEKRSELFQRLEDAGQKPAAEELRYRRALTETQKPGVLVLLDAWLEEVGKDAFGEELLDLREELDHDVNPRRRGQ